MLTTAIFSPSAALALGLLLLQPLTSAATLPLLHKKAPSNDATAAVNTTTCNGNTYTYRALAGYGSVSGSARDKFGDTLGGLGSSIAIEHGSWKRETNDSDGTELYTGILWALPDRGWNTNGTLNYNPRVHKLGISFSPVTAAAADGSSGSGSGSVSSPPNLHLEYLDTVLFSDPVGTPVTGLDPDFAEVPIEFPGFPAMPVATYEGDGFGGEGPGGRRVAVDSEGLVLGPDGEFWVSDEYGPFVYRFSREGRMLAAIRPPEAYVPRRNGNVSFSAASAPLYDPDRVPVPEDPTSGRANNQGFEGLTVSPDGSTLSVLLQSALMQDGGQGGKQTRRHARLLQYDITALSSSSSSPSFPHSSSSPHSSSTNTSSNPLPKAEFVVPLPTFANADGKPRVAAQSEILALSPTQFLVLARDSNAGRAAESTESLYRQVDVFDVSAATDVFGDDDSVAGSVAGAEDGVLDDGIAPAEYCAWLDFNVGSELARFGLHNGGVDDEGLLNEKWESLAVVPVLGEGGEEVEGEWWVVSLSDDDFITQDGYMDGGEFQYSDGSGASLDNQALVFRVGLEKGLRPAGW